MNGSETAAPPAVIDANPVGAGARWAIMGISLWTTTGVGVVSAVPTGIGGHSNYRVCGPFWSGAAPLAFKTPHSGYWQPADPHCSAY